MSTSRRAAARLAGFSLLAAALGFLTVFTLLALSFDYPDILDRSAAEVLPRLLALGPTGRATWAVYAVVPLLLVPAAAGLAALHGGERPRVLVTFAAVSAVLAGLFMTLGLVRWPSMQWELARGWATASADQRLVLGAVFDGLNTLLGRYLGEFLGELMLNLSFLSFATLAWQDRLLPRWVSGFGFVAATAGLVALWRNVTGVVAPVADLNNALLPLWLIVWSVALLRVRAPATPG